MLTFGNVVTRLAPRGDVTVTKHNTVLSSWRKFGFLSPATFIMAGLLIRLVWASYIAYLGPTVGLVPDAQSFYIDMTYVAKTGIENAWEIGPNPLINVMAIWIRIFGESVFGACVPACIAWWLSGVTFLACARILSVTSAQLSIFAALYAFWPSAIYYTGEPIRESFQLFFIAFSTWGALMVTVQHRPIGWIPAAIGVGLAATLHGGLTAYALAFMATVATTSTMAYGRKFPIGRAALALMVATAVVYYGYSVFSTTQYDLSGGALEAAQKYQEGAIADAGRATYKEEIVLESRIATLAFLPFGLFQYWFEPFPQNIGTVSDAFLALENTFRGYLFIAIFFGFRTQPTRVDRVILVMLFTLYVEQELIWSAGTVNWGTASRHHIPALGLLLLVAIKARVFAPRIAATPQRRLLSA